MKQKKTPLPTILVCLTIGFLAGIVFDSFVLHKKSKVRSYTVQESQPIVPNSLAPQNNDFSIMEQLVAKNPGDPEAWVKLGHLYFDSNQYIKAISAYKSYLDLKPDNADVWTDLGVMYRRNKQPEKAIKAFDRAIKANPRHEPSRFNKGIVLMHDLNQLSAAIQAWKELLKINPEAKASDGMFVKDLVARIERPSEKK